MLSGLGRHFWPIPHRSIAVCYAKTQCVAGRRWTRSAGRNRGVICPSCAITSSLHANLAALDVSDEHVQNIQSSSSFTSNAEEALATLVALTSKQRVRTLILSNPELLCAPLGLWLDFLTAYGMSRQEFCRLLGSCPHLFIHGSVFSAGNIMAYLQSLGLSPRDVVASAIPRCPRLLLADLASQIRPVVTFLQEELGLEQTALRSLLCRCPEVLLFDVASELRPRLEALGAAGFDKEGARRTLYDNASLLVGDVASALSERLVFLRHDCGFTPQQAVAVLTSCPDLLGLTLPNLGRKWRFLTDRMQCGRDQVLAYPQFWSKNLLYHIGPRFSYLTDRIPASPADLPHPQPPDAPKQPLISAQLSLQSIPPAPPSQQTPSAASALDSATGSTSAAAAETQDGRRGALLPGSSGTASCTGGESAPGIGGRGSGVASASCGSGGSEAPWTSRLNLKLLLEPDDKAFLAMVWAPGGETAIRGLAPPPSQPSTSVPFRDVRTGTNAEVNGAAGGALTCGGGDGPGDDGGDGGGVGSGGGGAASSWAEDHLADYQRFRSEWLEREGARWTGVRAGGGGMAGGSW